MHLFSSDSGDATWKSDEEQRSKVESAAFGLLSLLGENSARGRRAIAEVDGYELCHVRALEIISALGTTSAPQETEKEDEEKTAEDDEPSAEEEETPAEADEYAEDSPPDLIAPPEDTHDTATSRAAIVLSDMNENELELVRAALAYIFSMILVPKVRAAVLGCENIVGILSSLVADDKMPRLQFEAVKIVAKLAPHAGSADFSLDACLVGKLLLSALEREKLSDSSLYVEASNGIQFVFDEMKHEQQKATVSGIAALLAKVLKSHALVRTSRVGEELAQGGILAYQLTTLLLLSNGKESVQECFDLKLLLTLVNIVQWRYDPKTEVKQDQVCYWDAATTQALQILSTKTRKSESALKASGIKLNDLKHSVYMVSRPGRAPRKAIDLPSALKLVVKTGDPATKLAAMSVESCLC